MYLRIPPPPVAAEHGMGILPLLLVGGVTAIGAAAAWWQVKEEEEYQQFKKGTERIAREALRTPPTPLAPPPGTVYRETVAITPSGGVWTPEQTIDPLAFREWWRTRDIGTPDPPNGTGGLSPWVIAALVVGGIAAVRTLRG